MKLNYKRLFSLIVAISIVLFLFYANRTTKPILDPAASSKDDNSGTSVSTLLAPRSSTSTSTTSTTFPDRSKTITVPASGDNSGDLPYDDPEFAKQLAANTFGLTTDEAKQLNSDANLVDTAYATGQGRDQYPQIWQKDLDPDKDATTGAFLVKINIYATGLFKVDASKTHADVAVYYSGKAPSTGNQDYDDIVHFVKSGGTWTPTGVN